MVQTSKERLKDLLNKHVRHNCTPEEEKELAQLIALFDDKFLKKILFSGWKSYESPEVLSENKTKEILTNILLQPKRAAKRAINIRLLFRYSAAAIVLIALLLFFNRNESKNTQIASYEPIQIQLPSSREAVDYTRNISLPDGSSVILHKGSTLDYDDDFSKTSREVNLSGEAYFDIAHKPEQPFIIHSGTVKTIVLGTAFSIKAWPNKEQIVVTVTRGSVKVENNNAKILAVLTANQQLDYNMQEQESQIQTISTSAEQAINEWIKEDMTFNQVPLSQIVPALEKRYKVNIHIREKSLGEKIIVSSFNGMESLSGVLDMLCMIMPEMYYEVDNENNITLNKIK